MYCAGGVFVTFENRVTLPKTILGIQINKGVPLILGEDFTLSALPLKIRSVEY